MKQRFKVYLAGPISGLTHDEAQDWRSDVTEMLRGDGIDCYSPLRQKHFLADRGVLEGSYADNPLSTDRGIMTRDHFDCQTADLIFVNPWGGSRISVGTVMEIAWGFAYRKPVVAVMERNWNRHDHPMIREAIGYRVETMEDAVAITRAILLPHAEKVYV